MMQKLFLKQHGCIKTSTGCMWQQTQHFYIHVKELITQLYVTKSPLYMQQGPVQLLY